MKVKFLTHEEDGRMEIYTGNVNGWGFNLILSNGSIDVEIVDSLGKEQTYQSFDVEKKAVLRAFLQQN